MYAEDNDDCISVYVGVGVSEPTTLLFRYVNANYTPVKFVVSGVLVVGGRPEDRRCGDDFDADAE